LAERNKRTETQQSSPADSSSPLFFWFLFLKKSQFSRSSGTILKVKAEETVSEGKIKLNGNIFLFAFIPLLYTCVVVEDVCLYVWH